VEKIFPPIYAEKHRVSPKVSSCFAEALICSLTANQRSQLQVISLQKKQRLLLASGFAKSSGFKLLDF
jgi:hypothetical protein